MSSAMLRTALASLRYRTARLTLLSLAILLGVAFVTGTLVLGASMNQAFFNSFAACARNVDAAVSPHDAAHYRPGNKDAPALPPSVLSQVGGAAGVRSAAGRLVGQAPLVGSDGKAQPQLATWLAWASTWPPTRRCAASRSPQATCPPHPGRSLWTRPRPPTSTSGSASRCGSSTTPARSAPSSSSAPSTSA